MDELDELLTPGATPARNDDAVWRQARAVLRRRRWIRRGSAMAVMAGCFLAGALAFRLPPHEQPQIAKHEQPVERATPPKKAVDPFRDSSPDNIEQWAFISSGDKQVELYRRAGDEYLKLGKDLAALRCYRTALDSGGKNELVVRQEDTWLMTSLKLARQKERN